MTFEVEALGVEEQLGVEVVVQDGEDRLGWLLVATGTSFGACKL
jgi:hypothetical protein